VSKLGALDDTIVNQSQQRSRFCQAHWFAIHSMKRIEFYASCHAIQCPQIMEKPMNIANSCGRSRFTSRLHGENIVTSKHLTSYSPSFICCNLLRPSVSKHGSHSCARAPFGFSS
jgi:hypothetical protein